MKKMYFIRTELENCILPGPACSFSRQYTLFLVILDSVIHSLLCQLKCHFSNALLCGMPTIGKTQKRLPVWTGHPKDIDRWSALTAV
jgi:hypothetical protein